MTTTDPTYPNPAIVEAICEFHFSTEDNQQNWDGKWFGRLHSQLGENYEMEPKTTANMFVQSSQPGISLPLKMLYQHKTNKQLIQLAPWLLTVNEIGRYQNWKMFLDHIEYAWKSLQSIINPIQVKRIGMRYINRIPRISSEEKVGDWINLSDLIPKRILAQQERFFFRCEIPQTDEIHLIVTLTEEQIKETIKPLIFDLDTVIIKNQDNNWEILKQTLIHLHDIIKKEFNESLTKKFKDYLNQKTDRNKN